MKKLLQIHDHTLTNTSHRLQMSLDIQSQKQLMDKTHNDWCNDEFWSLNIAISISLGESPYFFEESIYAANQSFYQKNHENSGIFKMAVENINSGFLKAKKNEIGEWLLKPVDFVCWMLSNDYIVPEETERRFINEHLIRESRKPKTAGKADERGKVLADSIPKYAEELAAQGIIPTISRVWTKIEALNIEGVSNVGTSTRNAEFTKNNFNTLKANLITEYNLK